MRPNAATSSLLSLHLLWMSALLTTLALLLTGCGMGPRLIPSAAQGATLQGRVHGGQQPIANSQVYLLAAGTSAFGAASSSLLSSGDGSDDLGNYVLSDAAGNFSITGDYTCVAGQQVYALAKGGNAGGGVNSAIGLMAVLGACPVSGTFATATPFIEINEVSTVAAAYALSGFATDSTHIADDEGASGNPTAASAQTGMMNAFANASNLADLGSGVALATTPAGNGTVPQATLNTLANILASCVNTSDLAVPVNGLIYSSGCINLGLAVSGGDLNQFTGYTYDTATAAIFIAHNPSVNVAALYNTISAQPPFTPTLATQPADFSIQLAFTGGGITNVSNLAIDAIGNVWLTDDATLDELGPLGAPVSPSTGYTASGNLSSPHALAIDTSNDVWALTNLGEADGLVELSPAGSYITTSVGASYAVSVAIDPSGNLWVPYNSGPNADSLDEFSPSGTRLNNFTGGGLNNPSFLSIDASGNLWLPNNASTSVSLFSSAGVPNTSSPFTTGISAAPVQTALVSIGELLVLSDPFNLSIFSSSGSVLGSFSPNLPQLHGVALAIDGGTHIWNLVETDQPGPNPAYALLLVGSAQPYFYLPPGVVATALATDASGNLWLPEGSHVVEYVGLSGPTVTPLAAAVTHNKLAILP